MPESMNVQVTRMDRPDAFDFNSTKYDCNRASLTTKEGIGIQVEFLPDQRHHCRAGTEENGGYVLYVNRQVSPPDDISSGVVKEFFLHLKKGDEVRGSFRVGSPVKP